MPFKTYFYPWIKKINAMPPISSLIHLCSRVRTLLWTDFSCNLSILLFLGRTVKASIDAFNVEKLSEFCKKPPKACQKFHSVKFSLHNLWISPSINRKLKSLLPTLNLNPLSSLGWTGNRQHQKGLNLGSPVKSSPHWTILPNE